METATILRLFIRGGYGHHDFFLLIFLYASTTSTLTPSRALFLLGANIMAHHHPARPLPAFVPVGLRDKVLLF